MSIQDLITSTASKYNVDASTATSIWQTEGSVTNPNALTPNSSAPPDVGIMQIQPATALSVWRASGQYPDGVTPLASGAHPSSAQLAQATVALQDPKVNIDTGVHYMALQKSGQLVGGSTPQSPADQAAAYNSGGVYKDANGNYTQGNGQPGGVGAYVSRFNNHYGGSNSGTASSSSGTPSSVSPHAIPDQAGKYKGVEGLYLPIENFNVSSPFLAYVQLTIGGAASPSVGNTTPSTKVAAIVATPTITTVTNVSPDMNPNARKMRITDFNFQEGMESGSGHFVLKLFLESADEINWFAALVNKYKQLNLVWGYQQSEGMLIRSFTGSLLHFSHQFQSTGYAVLIEGMDAAFAGLTNMGSDSYAPVTGRASDVVSWIASQHGWDTAIERTIKLYDGDDPHRGPRVFMRHTGESEMSFINSTLIPLSQSDIRSYGNTPFGHYRSFFVSDNKGSGTLHFHSVQVATADGLIEPVRTYVWGGLGTDHRASVVRDFVMDYTGVAFMNGQLTVVSTDPTSGQVNTAQAAGQQVIDYPVGANHPVGAQDSTRTAATNGKTKDETNAKMLQKYLELRDASFKANLTILGDPFLRCGDVVNVTIMRPGQSPQLFYNWIVMSMTHNIAGGDYLLNCEMIMTTATSPVETKVHLSSNGATMTDYANQL